ncbi:MAG: alpha/beta hydrolase family protein [Gemmatimonadaceae bacterium]
MTRLSVWLAAAAIALLALGGAAWLLRDPEPVFAARTGRLVRVDTLVVRHERGMLEQELTLVSTTGLRVHVAVRCPAPAPSDTARRTLFLLLGGHERGRGAAALIADTRGTVVASLDYPFDGNHRAKGLAVVAQVPSIRRALYDSPPAVTLVLDYLLGRPDVDTARIELVGASFGASFATIAAARDPRVTRLWIAHGGGKPFAMINTGLEREIPFAPLRWPVAGLATLLASGPRFAAERWVGRVSPRPVVMLNALEDERIPRASVDALWNAAQEPRSQVWLPGRHMQGNRQEVLRALVDTVMTRAGVPFGALGSAATSR